MIYGSLQLAGKATVEKKMESAYKGGSKFDIVKAGSSAKSSKQHGFPNPGWL